MSTWSTSRAGTAFGVLLFFLVAAGFWIFGWKTHNWIGFNFFLGFAAAKVIVWAFKVVSPRFDRLVRNAHRT